MNDETILEHAPPKIREDIEAYHKRTVGNRYVGDFVFGALDGSITTFAVVAGAAGALLGPHVVLILGMANLLGDGASMALGNYLGTKSEEEFRESQRRREEWETEEFPDLEKEEVRKIYLGKGFRGQDLDRAVEIITSDKKTWVDTMMREELNISTEEKSPSRSGLATFVSFVGAGSVPLLPYFVALLSPSVLALSFGAAIVMTFLAIFTVGTARSIVTGKKWWMAGLEMTIIGAIAASMAYLVGRLLGALLA